jgi:XTP/dITP diphosphohydrolase
MRHLTFVTQSQNKVAEASRILGVTVRQHSLDLPELQSVEVDDVIAYKVEAAYRALGGVPVFVEDTGLYIAAWNGLPGALIKWFIERVGTEGICQMMHQYHQREAVAKTVVALYDGQLKVFAGEVRGRIATAPAGTAGFGWDRIFIPQGSSKTFAEMTSDEKDAFSMRRMALEKMADSLS